MTGPSRHRLTFPHSFKLKSRKAIQTLYAAGDSLFSYPVLIKYLVPADNPEIQHVQASFTVPKRAFPHACDRNRIKRKMKESFRLHFRQHAPQLLSEGLYVMFIYTQKEELSYQKIESGIINLLKKLHKEKSSSVSS